MSETSIQVRAAVVSDVETIARVHVRAWQRAFRGQIPDEVLDSLDEKKRAARCVAELENPASTLLVATQGGGVVGFCLIRPSSDAGASNDTAEIVALYVDPDQWRRGVGRALIDATLTLIRQKLFHRLTLWVLESNAPARLFYERVGFQSDGDSKVEHRPGYSLSELRYVTST